MFWAQLTTKDSIRADRCRWSCFSLNVWPRSNMYCIFSNTESVVSHSVVLCRQKRVSLRFMPVYDWRMYTDEAVSSFALLSFTSVSLAVCLRTELCHLVANQTEDHLVANQTEDHLVANQTEDYNYLFLFLLWCNGAAGMCKGSICRFQIRRLEYGDSVHAVTRCHIQSTMTKHKLIVL